MVRIEVNQWQEFRLTNGEYSGTPTARIQVNQWREFRSTLSTKTPALNLYIYIEVLTAHANQKRF